MKRLLVALIAVGAVGAAAALSQRRGTPSLPAFQFQNEPRNPVSHLRWKDPQEFQFAIVSDRTGGHRANVFAQALEKLNLLQPEFVIAVGDLIEGAKKDKELALQWD